MSLPDEGHYPGGTLLRNRQLLELLEEFIRWPFAPSSPELVGRLEDDSMVDDSNLGLDEEGPGGLGMGNTTLDAF